MAKVTLIPVGEDSVTLVPVDERNLAESVLLPQDSSMQLREDAIPKPAPVVQAPVTAGMATPAPVVQPASGNYDPSQPADFFNREGITQTDRGGLLSRATKQIDPIMRGLATSAYDMGKELVTDPLNTYDDIHAGLHSVARRAPDTMKQIAGGLQQFMNEAPVYDPSQTDIDGFNPTAGLYNREGMSLSAESNARALQGGTLAKAATIAIEADRTLNPRATKTGKMVESAGESILQQAPGIGLALAGQPWAALPLMGAQTFGQKYAENRSKGISIADATENALIQSGVEVGTELLPFVTLAKKMKPGQMTTKVVDYLLSEVPGEHIATALQNSSDAYFEEKDPAKRMDAVKSYLSSHKFTEDQIDTFWTVLMQGSVMTAGAKIADRVRPGDEVPPPSTKELAAVNAGLPPVANAQQQRQDAIAAADTPEEAAARLTKRNEILASQGMTVPEQPIATPVAEVAPADEVTLLPVEEPAPVETPQENPELAKLQERQSKLKASIFDADGNQKKNASQKMLDNYAAVTASIESLNQEVKPDGVSALPEEASNTEVVPQLREATQEVAVKEDAPTLKAEDKPVTPEITPIKTTLKQEQQDFVRGKVEAAGTIEKVRALYPDKKAPVHVYANALAAQLYGKPLTPEVNQNGKTEERQAPESGSADEAVPKVVLPSVDGQDSGSLPVLQRTDAGITEPVNSANAYEQAQNELDAIRPTIKPLTKPEPQHIVMDVQGMNGKPQGRIAAPYDGTKEDALRVAKALKLHAAEDMNGSMRESAVFAADKDNQPVYEFTQGEGITEVHDVQRPADAPGVQTVSDVVTEPVAASAAGPFEKGAPLFRKGDPNGEYYFNRVEDGKAVIDYTFKDGGDSGQKKQDEIRVDLDKMQDFTAVKWGGKGNPNRTRNNGDIVSERKGFQVVVDDNENGEGYNVIHPDGLAYFASTSLESAEKHVEEQIKKPTTATSTKVLRQEKSPYGTSGAAAFKKDLAQTSIPDDPENSDYRDFQYFFEKFYNAGLAGKGMPTADIHQQQARSFYEAGSKDKMASLEKRQKEKQKQKEPSTEISNNHQKTIRDLGPVGTKVTFKQGFNNRTFTITDIEDDGGKVAVDGEKIYRFASDFKVIDEASEPTKAKPEPTSEPTTANKIFTEDAASAARERLRKKLSQLNSGIDPEMMQDGITLAGYHIEKGARTFAAFAKAMLSDLGEAVKPYLKSWYMGVKYDPRAVDFEGIDSAATVDSADIEAVLKEEETPAKQTTEQKFKDKYPDSPWLYAPGVFTDKGEFERGPGLTGESLRVETDLFDRMMTDPEKMIQEYLNLAHPVPKLDENGQPVLDAKGDVVKVPGNRTMLEIMQTEPVVINPDEGRALSRDYELNPGKFAHATHEPVSALAKMVGAQALTIPDPRGINRVLVLGGGGGSGKVSAMKATAELKDIQDNSQIIFDGTMAKMRNLVKAYNDSVKNGKEVVAVHVFRDMPGAVSGIVGRKWDNATVLDGEVIPGRDVPVHAAAEAHFLSGGVFLEFYDQVNGNENIQLRAVANLPGEKSQEVSIDRLRELVQSKTEDKTYLEFKPYVQSLYDQFDNDPQYNPYVKGGEFYGSIQTKQGRRNGNGGIEGNSQERTSAVSREKSSEQSSSGRDNESAVREPGQERGEQDPDNVTPEQWWDGELTRVGREEIIDVTGAKAKPGTKWRYLPADVKTLLLLERGGAADPIGGTNVNSSNEGTRTGGDATASVNDAAVPGTAGNATIGDVAGEQPDAVQGPGSEGDTGPALDDGSDVGNDSGSGSGRKLSTPRATRNDAGSGDTPLTTGSARNFTITNELNFEGQGAKTKYRNNVEAIKLLQTLDRENRPATPDEQSTLAKYVGWGGIPQAFDSKKKDWAKEYDELKALLTAQEYETAISSTRNAHYTAGEVVKAAWNIAERLGFVRGSVLESSLGTGNFFGLMPRELRSQSKLTGVEFDHITGSIAKHLYPQARVHAPMGFQEIQLQEGSFDLAIGNPPFGAEQLYDPNNKDISKFKIHGFFFAKELKALRPGGLLVNVVTKGFLDANDATAQKTREWLSTRARLVGAIRLPDTAFKTNAATEITTDIIILQKLAPGEQGNAGEWNSIATIADRETGGEIRLNQYFVNNPEMLMGEMTLKGSMRRAAMETLSARPGDNLPEMLQKAIESLPEGIMKTGAKTTAELAANPKAGLTKVHEVRPYNFFVEDGKIYQRLADLNGEAVSIPLKAEGATKERISQMIEIRDTLRRQLLLESSADSKTGKELMEQNRKRLNVLYDAFVKKFGYLNNDHTKRLMWEDADSALLRSLEKGYDKGVSAASAKTQNVPQREPSIDKKADIFTKRVLKPSSEVTKVETADEALMAAINERGRVDFNYMRGIYHDANGGMVSEEQIIKELGDRIYEDPRNGWVPKDEYLSGNVKLKLVEAEQAAKEDSRYARNVAALEEIQPPDVQAADIYVAPHSFWLTEDVFHKFAADIFKGTMQGGYSKSTAKWIVQFTSGDSTLNSATYGTSRMSATQIMATLMANKQISITDTVGQGKDARQVLNATETAAAQGKADELVELFQEWIWKDSERRNKLVARYNDLMNTDVDRKFDGSHLTLPGLSPGFKLRPHQKNVIYRAIQKGVVLLDHVVGSGKTAIMAATSLELRRLGMANKPMITVPNHIVVQTASTLARLYPQAKILAATKKDFEKANRKLLFAKIATGDWDVVIAAHSSFKFIPVPREIEKEILDEQKREIVMAMEEAKRDAGKNLTVKDLQKAKEKIDTKLQNLADMPKDDLANFAEMGVDALFVDEAHEFKNLFYTTSMQNVAGLGNPSGSGRAFDMFVKTQYLMRRNGGKGVYFATGTPISNSLAEVFHMQRFLQYQELKNRGVHQFDAWASAFGQATSDWEQNAGGRYKQKTRFRKLVNLPELKQLWGNVTDTVTNNDIIRDMEAQGKTFPLPKIEGGKPTNVVTERSPQQADYIGIPREKFDADGKQMFDLENGQPLVEYDPHTIIYRMENWAQAVRDGNTREIPLVITGDARKAGLDFRLIDENSPDFAGSKVNTAVNEIHKIYEENDERAGVQLVFIDLSTPKAHKGKKTAQLAESTPTYFVRDHKGLVHVAGKPVTLNMEGAEFFSFKKGKTTKIFERMTGYEVAEGATLTEAKERANVKLDRQDPEAWRKRTSEQAIPDEQIDEYIERYEEDKRLAEEDNGAEEKESAEEEISFDDLLADSGKSDFSVYDDIKAKLIKKGIKPEQIAFIHDANTDAQKADLFARVNKGIVRVLLGSTVKMGAGTNVQKRLVALHHLDAPWKPSDLMQREGRIVRQGNEFYALDPDGFMVKIRRYATKQTYDARMWEIIEIKARSIELFRTGGKDVREVDDPSMESANAEEMKAGASDNPLILEDIQLKNEIKKYDAQEKSYRRSRYELEDKVKAVEEKSAWPYKRLAFLEKAAEGIQPKNAETLGLVLGKAKINKKDDMNAADMFKILDDAYTKSKAISEPVTIGSYRGTTLRVVNTMKGRLEVQLISNSLEAGATTYDATDNFSVTGFFTRLDYALDAGLQKQIKGQQDSIANLEESAKSAKEELKKPFKHADTLKALRAKHKKVIDALRSGKKAVEEEAAAVEPLTAESDADSRFTPETDTAPMSKEDRENIRFKEGDGKGVDAFDVRNVVTSLLTRWGNAPPVKVVQAETDLPKVLVDAIHSVNAEGQVRGIFHNDKIWIIADNMEYVDDAETILIHEAVGHYGLRNILGKKYDAVLGEVIRIYGQKGLQDIATRYKYDLTSLSDRMKAAEEKLAEMAEKNEKPAIVAKVIAMLKQWLRDMGFNIKMNEKDLQALIAKAEGWVKRSQGDPVVYDGINFMTAWHGSPHDHNGFDMGKVGTGEGNASFGYGLYFTEAKDIAEWYKNELAQKAKGRDPKLKELGDELHSALMGVDMLGFDTYSEARQAIRQHKDWADRWDVTSDEERGINALINAYESRLDEIGKGKLYQVELAPEQDEYLLWDKPLVEQSEKVKAALSESMGPGIIGKEQGQVLYRHLAGNMSLGSDKAASGYLHSIGIRGIKYPSGTMTGTGTGKFNYVIFNDQDVTIEAKFSMEKGQDKTYFYDYNKGDRRNFYERLDVPAMYKGDFDRYGKVSVEHYGIPITEEEAAEAAAFGFHEYQILPAAVGSDIAPVELKYPHRLLVHDGILTGKSGPAITQAQREYRYDLTANNSPRLKNAFDMADDSPYFSIKKRTGNPDLDAALDKIGAKPKPFKERLAEVKDRIGLKVEQGFFDKFASLKELDKLAGVTGADDSAYISARMSTSLSDIVYAMMQHGHPIWKDGGSAVSGKGLSQIFAPVAGELDEFLGWMVGGRAQKLMAEGRENYFTQDEIDTLLAQKTPENAARWELVRREYVQYKTKVLDFAQQAGVIDPEARKKWDHEEYVPFYRIVEEQLKGPGNKKGLASQTSGIRTLKGGDARLGDVFENIIKNFTHLVDASLKNRTTELAIEKAMQIGVASKAPKQWKAVKIDAQQIMKNIHEIVGETQDEIDLFFDQQDSENFLTLFHPAAPKGTNIIHVLREGKPEYYEIGDPLLLRSLTSLNDTAFTGYAMDAMRTTKRWLTIGVTAAPDFMLRNFVRDAASAWVMNRGAFVPGVSSVTGAVKAFRQDDDMIQLMAAGGAFHGGYALGSDPGAAKMMVEKLIKKKGIDASTILNTPKKLWEFWQQVGGAMENAARVQTYANVKKSTGSHLQAAFEAKDLMDFSMRGDWAAINFLCQTVPFLGARIQGLQRLGKGALENPASFLTKGSLITLASILLFLINKDDDRYKELEEWDKDTYYHFWINGHHGRLPKPFEVGAIFGTIPERLTEVFLEKQHDKKLFTKRMIAMINQTFAVGLPQILNEPAQQWANKDFFTGRPIVGQQLDKLLPGDQADAHTSATAATVGQATGVSPKRIEHVIKGFFGTIGSYALAASDIVTRRMMDYPNQPTTRMSDMPVLKAFYRGDGSPANNTKYTTSFYELLNEVDKTYNSVQDARKDGNDKRAEKLVKENEPKLQTRAMVHNAQKQLANINRQMKAIHAERDMSSDDKRKALDELQSAKNSITKSVMESAQSAR